MPYVALLERAGSCYNLGEAASRHGPVPSCLTVVTGAAGPAGGRPPTKKELALAEEEAQLAARDPKGIAAARARKKAAKLKAPPGLKAVPAPHEYEGSPFPAAASKACVESKANGWILEDALAAIQKETLEEMKALRKTTFVFKPSEEQYERELHIFAAKVRSDHVLKPIIERTVSGRSPPFRCSRRWTARRT